MILGCQGVLWPVIPSSHTEHANTYPHRKKPAGSSVASAFRLDGGGWGSLRPRKNEYAPSALPGRGPRASVLAGGKGHRCRSGNEFRLEGGGAWRGW